MRAHLLAVGRGPADRPKGCLGFLDRRAYDGTQGEGASAAGRACGQLVARVALVDNPAAGAAGRTAPGGWRIEIALPDLPGARS